MNHGHELPGIRLHGDTSLCHSLATCAPGFPAFPYCSLGIENGLARQKYELVPWHPFYEDSPVLTSKVYVYIPMVELYRATTCMAVRMPESAVPK